MKSFLSKSLRVLAPALMISVPLTSSAAPRRALVVAVGDSTLAGYLADTSAVNSTPATPVFRTDLKQIGKWVADPGPIEVLPDDGLEFVRTLPFKLLRLASVRETKYTHSWATGSLVNSHFTRIKKYFSQKDPGLILEPLNVAASGAIASDLPAELKQITKAWKTGKYESIKYIAIAIGPNDICNLSSNYDYATRMREFFRDLAATVKQKEPIHVLVASSPRMPDFAFNFGHVLPNGKTCKEQILNVNKYCNRIVDWANPNNPPSEYQWTLNQLASRNQMMEDVIDWVNKDYKDRFKIAFSKRPSQWQIPISSMAKDCFHLNIQGQADGAEVLWNDVPWFK